MSPRRARMALSLVCEPGDARLPGLLADLGPIELLSAVRSGRRAAGRSWPAAWTHAAQTLDHDLDRARGLADVAGLRWIVPGDRDWPTQLDDLDHVPANHGATGAPLGLWARGASRLADLASASVAIVGARDCTAYGAETAAEIAADVACARVTVVSGAAFGIDASAHRGALATLNPTIAILACDAATNYPRAHAALLQRIGDEGLVISEQPPGQVPTKARFLSRNRIIAALTSGTVVVEARRRSGSLNTLAWADQLGRTTMAVPGPVTSQHSSGTHQAIRDGKAVLVTAGPEVLSELSGFNSATAPQAVSGNSAEGTAFDALTAEQAKALDALDWKRPFDVDAVARRAGLSSSATAHALARLAAGGWASRVDGSAWILTRRADLE